ncbi:MAG: YD repeat-containing protein [Cognaticolwellia sp.]|jgi:YD repeat-containing protein
MSLMLLSLSLGCLPENLGGREDTLGHPRFLLADCVRDAGGLAVNIRYDSDGYLSSAEWPDGEVSFQERSILDVLGRPVVTERSTPQSTSVTYTERSYVADDWKLASVLEASRGDEILREYSWARGGFLIQDGSDCVEYVDLALGIRPSARHQICDGEELGLTRYRWRDDRVVEIEQSGAAEPSLRIRYTYDEQGRLSGEQSELDLNADGLFEEGVAVAYTRVYTWDCEL